MKANRYGKKSNGGGAKKKASKGSSTTTASDNSHSSSHSSSHSNSRSTDNGNRNSNGNTSQSHGKPAGPEPAQTPAAAPPQDRIRPPASSASPATDGGNSHPKPHGAQPTADHPQRVTFNLGHNRTAVFKGSDSPHALADLHVKHCVADELSRYHQQRERSASASHSDSLAGDSEHAAVQAHDPDHSKHFVPVPIIKKRPSMDLTASGAGAGGRDMALPVTAKNAAAEASALALAAAVAAAAAAAPGGPADGDNDEADSEADASADADAQADAQADASQANAAGEPSPTKSAKKRNKKRKKRVPADARSESNAESEADSQSESKKQAKVDDAAAVASPDKSVPEQAAIHSQPPASEDFATTHKAFISKLQNLSAEDRKTALSTYREARQLSNPDMLTLLTIVRNLVPAATRAAANAAPVPSVVRPFKLQSPSMRAPVGSSSSQPFQSRVTAPLPLTKIGSDDSISSISRRDSKYGTKDQEKSSPPPLATAKQALPTSIPSVAAKTVPRHNTYQTAVSVVFDFYVKNINADQVVLTVTPSMATVHFNQIDTALHILFPFPVLPGLEKITTGAKVSLAFVKAVDATWPNTGKVELIGSNPQSDGASAIGSATDNGSTTGQEGSQREDDDQSSEDNWDDVDSAPSTSRASHSSKVMSPSRRKVANASKAGSSSPRPSSPRSPAIRAVARRAISEPPYPSGPLVPIYMKGLSVDTAGNSGSPRGPASAPEEYAPDMESLLEARQPAVGLLNYGIDCYINNIIQCLASIPKFVEYFTSGEYKAHINKNNPLSTSKGVIVDEFAKLLCRLASSTRAFVPSGLKRALEDFWGVYDSYTQQDAQEFLNFLLDAIHEDVNRILHKPSVEIPDFDSSTPDAHIAAVYWEAHKKRNDSIVVDTFQGQYKSQITCGECGNTSIKFDAFMNLSMEVPGVETVDFWLTLVRYTGTKQRVRLSVPIHAPVEEVQDMLGQATGLDPGTLHASLVADDVVIKKILGPDERVQKYAQARKSSASSLSVAFYEIPYQKDRLYFILTQVSIKFSRVGAAGSDDRNTDDGSDGDEHQMDSQTEEYREEYRDLFGYPLILDIPRAKYSSETLSKEIALLLHKRGLLKNIDADNIIEHAQQLFSIVEKQHPDIVEYTLMWREEYADHYFDMEKDREIMPGHMDQPSPTITPLDKCMVEHFEEEEVEDWYCSRCKGLRNGMKKLDLWKLPEVLIVHLKRFGLHPRYNVWTKLDDFVDYPLYNFNMGRYSVCADELDKSYELIAVSNHVGGTERGHYTAFCKRRDVWSYFDDDSVTFDVNEEYIANRNGYVLFYRLKHNEDSAAPVESPLRLLSPEHAQEQDDDEKTADKHTDGLDGEREESQHASPVSKTSTPKREHEVGGMRVQASDKKQTQVPTQEQEFAASK
ncbi:hypothetical protein BC831DRAFT_159468 [Entophlyctis helioformis]|nr:hypothetical protein BC831DRAFT_159468 [Entophlyctis helioformis]